MRFYVYMYISIQCMLYIYIYVILFNTRRITDILQPSIISIICYAYTCNRLYIAAIMYCHCDPLLNSIRCVYSIPYVFCIHIAPRFAYIGLSAWESGYNANMLLAAGRIRQNGLTSQIASMHRGTPLRPPTWSTSMEHYMQSSDLR